MGYKNKRGKRDSNQHLFEDLLNRLQLPWEDISAVGGGFGDILVGNRQHEFLFFEIKTIEEINNINEIQFRFNWKFLGYPIYRVCHPEEMAQLLAVKKIDRLNTYSDIQKNRAKA